MVQKSPVEVGRFSHLFLRVFFKRISGWWFPDFWTINSIIKDPNLVITLKNNWSSRWETPPLRPFNISWYLNFIASSLTKSDKKNAHLGSHLLPKTTWKALRPKTSTDLHQDTFRASTTSALQSNWWHFTERLLGCLETAVDWSSASKICPKFFSGTSRYLLSLASLVS